MQANLPSPSPPPLSLFSPLSSFPFMGRAMPRGLPCGQTKNSPATAMKYLPLHQPLA